MTDPRPGRGRRPRALAAAAVAALALAALTGCNDDEPTRVGGASSTQSPSGGAGSASPSPSASPSASTDAGSAASAGAPAAPVELLEAGAAPRRAVVLDVAAGHTESSTLEIRTTTEMTMLSAEPIELTVRLPYRSEVTAADDDRVAVTVTYGRPRIEAPQLGDLLSGQLDPLLRALEGTTADVVYTPSGAVVSSDLDLDSSLPGMLTSIVDGLGAQSFALAVPFPTEEIGLGARWRTSTAVDLGDGQAVSESTYELTELTDDGYTVEVTATQTGDGAKGSAPSLGGTTTATMTGRAGLIAPATTKGRGTLQASVPGMGSAGPGGAGSGGTVQVEVRGTTR